MNILLRISSFTLVLQCKNLPLFPILKINAIPFDRQFLDIFWTKTYCIEF